MPAEKSKLTTKEKLIASAVGLFSENWYDAISVAEICRNGGLSNGVFYRYYKDKEELFKEILDGFLETIAGRMNKIAGETVEERLVSFYGFILESNREDLPYISIFREGEYRYPEYEKRLRDIYMDALEQVYRRPVTSAEYLYLVGSVRFLLRRPCSGINAIDADFLKDLATSGVLHGPESIDTAFLDRELPPALDDVEDADTRTKLIVSGKKLIADNSFYKVNIYEITRNAGFAVGTFYLNFKSKEELFREVVKYLGKQLRCYIATNLEPGLNRVAREIEGWALFLKYFETHIQNYQIVREAEFIIRDTAQEYYNKFEEGYLKNEDGYKSDDKRISVNYLIGIAHFLGIESFFSKDIVDSRKVLEELSGIICRGIKT